MWDLRKNEPVIQVASEDDKSPVVQVCAGVGVGGWVGGWVSGCLCVCVCVSVSVRNLI